jgi:hypothetical protein
MSLNDWILANERPFLEDLEIYLRNPAYNIRPWLESLAQAIRDTPPGPDQRIMRRVTTDGDHWLWTGATSNGYPMIRRDGRMISCHRWLWEQRYGRLDPSQRLLSNCVREACVNPEHWKLRAGPARINRVEHMERLAAGLPSFMKLALPSDPRKLPARKRLTSKDSPDLINTLTLADVNDYVRGNRIEPSFYLDRMPTARELELIASLNSTRSLPYKIDSLEAFYKNPHPGDPVKRSVLGKHQCKRGHRFDAWALNKNGQRRCLECDRERKARARYETYENSHPRLNTLKSRLAEQPSTV